MTGERDPAATMREAYIDLVKRAVSNYLFLGGERALEEFRCVADAPLNGIAGVSAILC